jgi:hypothetical protein
MTQIDDYSNWQSWHKLILVTPQQRADPQRRAFGSRALVAEQGFASPAQMTPLRCTRPWNTSQQQKTSRRRGPLGHQ